MVSRIPGWLGCSPSTRLVRHAALLAVLGASVWQPQQASAQCSSSNPGDWPASAKPIVLVIADTSGSMSSGVSTNNACSYPNTRSGHMRCALRSVFQEYTDRVEFALAGFSRKMTGCGATCYTSCAWSSYPNEADFQGCGAEPIPGQPNSADRRSLFIHVPAPFDTTPPPASNLASLLTLVDNNCTGNTEFFTDGFSPTNGALRDAYRYLSSQWVAPDNSVTYPSPVAGSSASSCRSVNVVFLLDGGESCDLPADAADAAADLLAGFTIGSVTYSVRTWVIDVGIAGAEGNAIAAAGGTMTSYPGASDTEIRASFGAIMTSVVPGSERCDNVDNNCNGCVDEGFQHYCNQGQTCCAWSNPAQRQTCMTNFGATISPANPLGNRSLLPCTTAVQQASSASWLCVNPADTCDNVDNNCSGVTDEGVLKCGSPAHCPSAEICNGTDDDCDGVVDEGVCAGCVPSPEICDGCDNDCDGVADDGIAAQPCGFASPANCVGTRACRAAQVVATPGACVAGGGFLACTNSPQLETCDGADNDCNGVPDDNIASAACVPAGTPSGLSFAANSQCKRGATQCLGNMTQCVGFVGPSAERCDGIDNDCDGSVDEGIVGLGASCGNTQAPCTPGVTACVSGALVCQGVRGGSPELCDGIDNDCDGIVDDNLTDVPTAGSEGCWALPGNCCSFGSLNWCPPPGASCSGVGTLAGVCSAGRLTCEGGAWSCRAATHPAPELCDGLDNDCNGTPDDGTLLPPVGNPCGSDEGACQGGSYACVGGALLCNGSVDPVLEQCDGIDNDCNGSTDEIAGTECSGTYDTSVFPGARTFGPCRTGLLRCTAGVSQCEGAVVPTAELCDGIDNDCDGMVDEGGPAPEGITGSGTPPLGDACTLAGCTGQWACRAGVTRCDAVATAERCDGIDNDCDGVTDEGATLCGAGRVCARFGTDVRCLAPCEAGTDFCPAGQLCQDVTRSETGEALANYCVDLRCDRCPEQRLEQGGVVECAPAGTVAPGCVQPPACVCGPRGCQSPCAGIVCTGTERCAEQGPRAGTCVQADCSEVPCNVCGEVCAPDGTCIDDPCDPSPCRPGEICVRSADYRTARCEGGPVDAGVLPDVVDANNTVDVITVDLVTLQPDVLDDVLAPSDVVDGGTGAMDSHVGNDAGRELSGGGCACHVGSPTSPRDRTGSWSSVLFGLGLGTFLLGRRRRRQGAFFTALLGLGVGLQACTEPPLPGSDVQDDPRTEDTNDVLPNDVVSPEDVLGDRSDLLELDVVTADTQTSVDAQDTQETDTGAEDGTADVGPVCVPTNEGHELCDRIDNDCDGITDNVDPTLPGSCGGCSNDCYAVLRGCARAEVACAEGLCTCGACAPGFVDLDHNGTCECDQLFTVDDNCDGADDDCDGRADDDVDFCTSNLHCGACNNPCEAAHAVTQCQSNATTGCSLVDTACVIASCTCTPSECYWDADGLASNGCELRCEPSNGGLEICDGLDNDCDGRIDGADDLSSDVRIGGTCFADPDGVCGQPEHAGTYACLGGTVSCTGGNLLRENAQPERCNGLDDDCDGATDDTPTDEGAACGMSDVAPCRKGRQTCMSGVLTCMGAVDPRAETCNGLDDDCDGMVDSAGGMAPSDVGGPCAVPPAPPSGASSPCRAGTLACTAGRAVCTGSVGPTATVDACGVDSNCDGVLTGQPDLQNDPQHCGNCSTDCAVGAVHARWGCATGTCQFAGCEAGYYDLDGDRRCEYACVPTAAQETCNGIDDNCNGQVDEGVVAPTATQVCGVSSAATRPECTTGVTVSCSGGAWRCAFPAGVCTTGCASTAEICDGLDNDCDGLLNENVPQFGQACASDDGVPVPGDGLCRTTGTYACNGPSAVVCSAVKANCNSLPGGCTELCDGLDNDCDGLVDEPFSNKGTAATYFVKPAVTRIASALWIYSYEASRPSATDTSPGMGNGYWTSAPPGVQLEKTSACSLPSRLPWASVNRDEALQTCTQLGGTLCNTTQWQTACTATTPCSWGYNPRTVAACSTAETPTKFCNLGPFDFSIAASGNQDGLLATASPRLQNCWADWSGLQGNVATTNKIFDITGNLRELVNGTVSGINPVMGGSYSTPTQDGAACGVSTTTVTNSATAPDMGFRCCFTSDPTL